MAPHLNIFVTGANGCVGQAFTRAALVEGHNIATLTRRTFHISGTRNYILDKYLHADLAKVLNGQDLVVHLAAKAHQSKDDSPEVRASYYKVNVENTLELAKAALQAGVKKFIFVSSIKVNGERTQGRPFNYRDQPGPEDIYGVTKYQAELALTKLFAGSGVQLIIIRPPLVWGGCLKGNLKSLAGLIKWRIPLPLGGVHNRRSILSLDNLCSFLLLCCVGEFNAVNTFLIADAKVRTTAEIARLVADQEGSRPIIISVPKGFWWLLQLFPFGARFASKLCNDLEVDTNYACKVTGWTPK